MLAVNSTLRILEYVFAPGACEGARACERGCVTKSRRVSPAHITRSESVCCATFVMVTLRVSMGNLACSQHSLAGNNIRIEGWLTLAEALVANSSLQHLKYVSRRGCETWMSVQAWRALHSAHAQRRRPGASFTHSRTSARTQPLGEHDSWCWVQQAGRGAGCEHLAAEAGGPVRDCQRSTCECFANQGAWEGPGGRGGRRRRRAAARQGNIMMPAHQPVCDPHSLWHQSARHIYRYNSRRERGAAVPLRVAQPSPVRFVSHTVTAVTTPLPIMIITVSAADVATFAHDA